MTRFRTPAHLVSWAGRCPVDQQSAGKTTRRAKVKKGNRYLAGLLGETAVAAGRTQTREGARYRRLARRRGKAKAQVAIGNTQLNVYHTLLSAQACTTRTSAWTTTSAAMSAGRSAATSSPSHHVNPAPQAPPGCCRAPS